MFGKISNRGRPLSVHERLIYQDYFSQTVLNEARVIEDKVPCWLLKTMAGVVLRNCIYFRKNAYQPNTAVGVELLGHELTHVEQYLHGMNLWKYLWLSRNGYRKNPYEIKAYAKGAKIRADFMRQSF